MWKYIKNSSIISVGTVINTILGVMFYLIIARFLKPADFGIVSVVLSLAVIASDLFDFGINTAIVKQLSDQKKFADTFFTIKIILAISVIIFGLLSCSLISLVLFKSTQFSLLIWLGFLCASATILFGYWSNNLVAARRFVFSSGLNISSNTIRLLLTVILISQNVLSKELVLIIFSLSLLIVLPAVQIFGRLPKIKLEFDKKTVLSIFHFSKWIGASITLGSIFSRLDNFLLVTLASSFQTGIYTSVQRIFLTGNQLPSSIGSVLNPDFSSKNEQKIKKALKFYFLTSICISLGLFVFIFIADWLVPLLLGNNYSSAILPFKLLAIGSIFFILSMPANSYLIYTLGKSKLIFVVTSVQVVLNIVFNLIFIPIFQANGSALAYVISTFFGFIVYNFFLIKKHD